MEYNYEGRSRKGGVVTGENREWRVEEEGVRRRWEMGRKCLQNLNS